MIGKADPPANHPADGVSILPILENKADTRTKEWIYIWYRGRQVLVRNKDYSLVTKPNGTKAELTRYAGQFGGLKLKDGDLT